MATREDVREGMIARLDQVLISCNIPDHRKQAEHIIDTKFISYLYSQGLRLPNGEALIVETNR